MHLRVSHGLSNLRINNQCIDNKSCTLRENLYVQDDYDNYYYYEYIATMDSFWQAPEIDFRYETKTRKVMVDFKFDALYRYVFIESLMKSG